MRPEILVYMTPGNAPDARVPVNTSEKAIGLFQCITIDPGCVDRYRLMMQRHQHELGTAVTKACIKLFQMVLAEAA